MSPSDLESANLVLFGTRETNQLIAREGDLLPMHLDTAAARNYGLVYVFPMNERYILVSSGLPWWTRNEPLPAGFDAIADAERRRWRPHAGPAGALMHRPDFLLFKGGNEDVQAEGYFDSNWRLPPTAVASLRRSGVVTVEQGH